MNTTFANPDRRGESRSRREIDEAQRRAVYRIAGEPLARVPYAGGDDCADCGAGRGEYHVPGCEHERCPACGGLVITCDCAYGGPTHGAMS
jgi:hypothetical protein